MQNLRKLLERLIESEVDFVLVGGFAGVVHGSTLVTQDLDICAAITERNILSLRAALHGLNPKHRMNPSFKPSFFDVPAKADEMNNIYLETDLGILDILSALPPVGKFEEIKSRALEISIYNKKCKVISLDDLISIKESMKRPKDVQSTQELRLIKSKKS